MNILAIGAHPPSLLPDRQDSAFPYALATFAPNEIRGIILAGFVAAVMSASSALVYAVATIFSLDVYRRFWRKVSPEPLPFCGVRADSLRRLGRSAETTVSYNVALTYPCTEPERCFLLQRIDSLNTGTHDWRATELPA
jgi:Sodium:solute symporter family